MECAVHAVIEEPPAAATDFVRLHDARWRHLALPPKSQKRHFYSLGFQTVTRAIAPIQALLEDLYILLESYYLAAERPANLSLHTAIRKITTSLGAVINYTYRMCRATSSALSKYAIVNISLDKRYELGSKTMVFMYGYFAHGIDINLGTNNNGIFIADAIDHGIINLPFGPLAHRTLVQLTRTYGKNTEITISSHTIGFEKEPVDGKEFITCVAIDPAPCFGNTLMVAYSTGTIEIWKESVSMTDLSEALCEAVAQCNVPSYPFFCKFSPSGEIAVLLTVDDMYLMEWNGSSLSGIKLVEGSSADFCTKTKSKVLAAEWINVHEILSLSDKGELWLSRRSEMGYWQRNTQYILVEALPKDVGLTSWISRMQYDGRGILFLKMFGSHQIWQLKWDKTAMPDISIVDFPARESVGKFKTTQQSNIHEQRTDAGNVSVADFALEPHSSLIAVVVNDRSVVYVYSYPNIRFLHAVGPPKPHLKVGGLKFVTSGCKAAEAFLAVKWVEISLEIFQEQEDFDVDQKMANGRTQQSIRITVLYSLSSSSIQPQDWKGKTLADILSNNESEVTTYARKPKTWGFRRFGFTDTGSVPKLSVFRPTFPQKVPEGPKNTIMFEDAFSHRGHIFGKHLLRNGACAFKTEKPSQVSRLVENMPDATAVEAPVYSMEEFTRRKRGTL
ncbi:uncharacterized protein BXIN_1713 [Babesia sp. Xinjiang]|uniref:uncharacterized protein n=1 Tax=Babesia sp. Xinjiang TaxID=462227 RepID=UPI000A256DC6|nr:uncharacterized protein BXIN_1710 [Babesia sp. Xinjiang]XP_028871389.1 uncharacterized protein BXIN_1713 [Babesia sp. Xinjiang]ORM40930.1 hypothetical protein BXIN_1710 [Babesia sp. Xinjiang]ORM40933.1 hypothetical protein BXIN_1713 [Babesia sp. Xinjiang]